MEHAARGGRGPSSFGVHFNGAKLFDVEYPTFTQAGKVGVWTKADSVTHFDDLTIVTKFLIMRSNVAGGSHESSALAAAVAGTISVCRSPESGQSAERTVTVYVSTDLVSSEPVLRAYEQRSGVRVNAVYHTEETKSTGLANRLIAEKVTASGGRVLVQRARADSGVEVARSVGTGTVAKC